MKFEVWKASPIKPLLRAEAAIEPSRPGDTLRVGEVTAPAFWAVLPTPMVVRRLRHAEPRAAVGVCSEHAPVDARLVVLGQRDVDDLGLEHDPGARR